MTAGALTYCVTLDAIGEGHASESDSVGELSDSGDNLELDSLDLVAGVGGDKAKQRKSSKTRSKKKAIAVAPPKIPHLEGGLPAFLNPATNPLGPLSPQDPEKGARACPIQPQLMYLHLNNNRLNPCFSSSSSSIF